MYTYAQNAMNEEPTVCDRGSLSMYSIHLWSFFSAWCRVSGSNASRPRDHRCGLLAGRTTSVFSCLASSVLTAAQLR